MTVVYRVILCAVPLLSAACGGGGDGGGSKAGAGGKGRALSAEITVASQDTVSDEIRTLGTLYAERSVELRMEAAGRVRKVLFRDGSTVQAGTVLAMLDAGDLQAARDKAAARLQVSASFEERKRKELELGGSSRQEYESALADKDAAQADLALAQAQFDKTMVRAPFAGRLGIARIQEGQYVSIGVPVVSLVQEHPFRIDFSVPGNRAGLVRPGMKIQFDLEGREPLPAHITAVESILDSADRTLGVRAQVEGRPEGLVSGTGVAVSAPLAKRILVRVPAEALAGNGQGSVLWVLREGKAYPVAVQVGERDSDRIGIVSGINAGDTVVLVGASNVRQGMPIHIAGVR